MTRKEIFAKCGIEFDGNSHILFDGKWIPLFLKQGNSKVGKKVYTFSLPAGTKGTCICDCEGCYAKVGRYVFPNVIECLKRNQWFVENEIDFIHRAINAQIECICKAAATDAVCVRIHAAGDFNTSNRDDYATMWKMIAYENPSVLFWTYTKISQLENLFDDVPNANIVKSVINGIGFNFGHCDYIIDTYKKLKATGCKVYICRCGIDKNQHCQGCRHCYESDFVLFLEHSTDYKATEDPRFDELKALIESQAD